MTKLILADVLPHPLAETSIAIENASEIWQQKVVFEKGKRYLIYAPSGKGKSTFIHILYGLRYDFKGEAQVDNFSTQKINRTQWSVIRQKKMSIVFQDLRLFLNLTAWENIQVKAVLNSILTGEEIKQMADFLGIAHVLNKKTALLSYGERQRTAIIRALVQPFEWMLLDEPFSHLDTENIQKATQLILQKAQQYEAGILMTSLGDEYGWKFDQKLLL